MANEPSIPTATDSTLEEPPRWGLGDVAAGLGAGFLLSNVFVAGYLIFKIGGPDNINSESFQDIELSTVETVLLQLPLWSALILACVYAAHRKGKSLKEDFKLGFSLIDIPIGAGVAIAAQLTISLLYWLASPLVSEEDVSAPARLLVDTATTAPAKVIIFIAIAMIAPFVEELFFRGLTFRAFLKRTSPLWSMFLSGLLFGVVHFQGIQFPAFVALGMVFAWMTFKYGRLGPSIVAHAVFNGVSVIALFLA